MLSIGIVDITTVGSTICQRRISELAGRDGNHPEFAVHSLPVKEYISSVENQDWDKMGQLVTKSIAKLNLLDVSFIIIPSNTPHYAYETYATNSQVPVLNLIDITAEACQLAGLKKVAILGTIATMNNGLYKNKIEQKGIELVIPEVKICNIIHKFIMEEIVPDKVTENTKHQVLELIKSIECDGYILGCTELPEVYSTHDFKKPAIDTTRLLAEVAFDIAKHENIDKLKHYSL